MLFERACFPFRVNQSLLRTSKATAPRASRADQPQTLDDHGGLEIQSREHGISRHKIAEIPEG
jgi:hypothetical protein